MVRRVAVFGGSFNPPHRHHRAIAETLAQSFDEVIVVPCGPRPDKTVAHDVESYHRAAMVDMNFSGLAGVRVELFDLEQTTFTRTFDLEQRFAEEGEVWHVVGADLVAGGGRHRAPIQSWHAGEELWRASRFVIITRPGYDLPPDDLPPHHEIVRIDEPISSSAIRSRIFHAEPFEQWLLPRVAAYINRHRLYRGAPSPRSTLFRLDGLNCDIVYDERNERAVELARQLADFRSDDPELIVVLGGDGTMLRAVRQHWRRRLPFFGVNTGHLGFLLNQTLPTEVRGQELPLWQLPLLYVEVDVEGESGSCQRQTAMAFNDAWVERMTGQTAWIEVRVDGKPRLPQLVADGALIATSSGSTAYARAMGATPLPLGTSALLLVGSNVLRPAFWRPVVLPVESEVTLTTLDVDKRPLAGYVDGVAYGRVRRMHARVSNIARVEMVFAPPHDPAAKLAAIQFP